MEFRSLWRCLLLGVVLVLAGCSDSGVGAASKRASEMARAGSEVSDRSQGTAAVGSEDEPVVEQGSVPDLDAVVAKVFERAGDDQEVRDCLLARVPVEQEAAQVITRGGVAGDEAVVSVVRGCQRVVALADGWIGGADRSCVARALSSSPEDVVQAFHSAVVAPEGDVGETAGVEELSGRLKVCGP